MSGRGQGFWSNKTDGNPVNGTWHDNFYCISQWAGPELCTVKLTKPSKGHLTGQLLIAFSGRVIMYHRAKTRFKKNIYISMIIFVSKC